jgi:predicted DNA binding CopG/RHH family protein
MRYTELMQNGTSKTEIQEFLAKDENVPVTMRIPYNLRDSAKEAATLNGMNFASFVKLCIIEKLSKQG